jgi:type IV pilus assembly protein PilY1
MTHSIPGRVVVLDTNGDQFADRLYAGDMGGRVWRFDLWNGRPRASFGTGGAIATLGAGDTGATGIENNRRFYSAPDVALIKRRSADPYYNLAIGSGYRGHPLHTQTRDRFYSLRDKNPFGALTQAQYDALTPVTDAGLVDISDDPVATPVPTTAAGWKLELRLNGGWSGEKSLAEATTVGGTILFTTYQPEARSDADPCQPTNGINRAYALRVDSGRPVVDFNDDEVVDARDISTRLQQSGIAGEVSIALESVRAPGTEGDGQADGLDPLGRRGFCVVGVEVLKRCVVPGSVVRTWWQRTADNGAAP